jgi:Protein of unknown function (DUF2934)
MASRALKPHSTNSVSAPDNAVEPRVAETVIEDQIATRAYQLWQERGCPIGSPEQDWLEAERQLRSVERSTAEILNPTNKRTAWTRQRRSSNTSPWLDQPSSLSLPHFYVRSEIFIVWWPFSGRSSNREGQR